MSTASKPKVILAYSGGLDTSVILKWLSEKGFEVICFCADVGQQHEDFEAIKVKATNTGATKCVVTDLRKEFVENYIFEALKCNAIYEGRYLLGTSVARPCIAKEMVRIAKEEGALYVAHGATGKGNDQVRFEMCAQALDAKIKTIAPWRDAEFIESFKGRSDLLAYCTKHGIPVDAKPKSNYSIDENLFHTSYESGVLEDAACTYEESMFKMTVSPKAAPEESTDIEIEFVKGVPVKLTNKTDGTVKTDPLELFMYANEIGGANAIGRIDIVENRFVGIKSRGVYETPGGTLLRAAHMDLEGICMDREVKRITEGLASEFARLCYNGFWFAPEMDLIRNSITYSQKDVTGVVSLELYKGNVIVRGRTSPNALYNPDLASMDIEGGGGDFDYNPADAAGFIRINAVRLKTYAALRANTEK
ncbi:hypothetical protein ACHAXA_007723 [Cyclostephanos tholiformis]|uniref:Argininosuccinate synthase n=1 Tax=Cyclostephanos tholiformis TaxID=382380 RepID=A0ABD3RYB7_9STRA